MDTNTPQRPPLSQLIIFAIGQWGWSLASFSATSLLPHFYMPPSNGEETIYPTFIFQGAIIFGLALIGLIGFGGRVFDGITDPWIASTSDNMDSKYGKRRFFMGISALPFALFSFLVFYPLVWEESMINSVWLTFCMVSFYFFMTMYVVPFNALIGELGHHKDDRMFISTIISFTWALGFILGSGVYALRGVVESAYGVDSTTAFQILMGVYAIVSFITMMVPVLFLDEKKFCLQKKTHISPVESLKSVFSNKNFRIFMISDLVYWLSVTFILLGASYYVTALWEWEDGMASTFVMVAYFSSLALYVPINFMVKHLGKKKVTTIAFIIFATVFGLLTTMKMMPVSKEIMFYLLAFMAAFPLAAFAIIPTAIISDEVHNHEQKTGEQIPGMYFAARTFMQKMGISFANLIFPSLLILGSTAANPRGVLMTSTAACILCILGGIIFQFYKESTPDKTKS